jgi:hypothetical protein
LSRWNAVLHLSSSRLTQILVTRTLLSAQGPSIATNGSAASTDSRLCAIRLSSHAKPKSASLKDTAPLDSIDQEAGADQGLAFRSWQRLPVIPRPRHAAVTTFPTDATSLGALICEHCNTTTAISGGLQRQGIRTWPFFGRCGSCILEVVLGVVLRSAGELF